MGLIDRQLEANIITTNLDGLLKLQKKMMFEKVLVK